MILDKLRLCFKKIHKKDLELTERFLGSSPFHCAFWARRCLRLAIKDAAIYGSGRMLDAGCGLKPYKAYFKDKVDKYIGLDYSPKSDYLGNKADICGDMRRLPFKDNSFDTILCSEALEHIDTPEIVMNEFFRTIKKNGKLIITAPFIYPLHEGGNDFFRFTKMGLSSLVERYNFRIITTKTLCGSATTLATLLNVYLYEEWFMWNKVLYPLSILIRPLIWLLIFLINIIAIILEKGIRTKPSLLFNNLVVAKTVK